MNKKRYHAMFEVYTATDPDTGKTRRHATYIGPYYRIAELAASRFQVGTRFAPGVFVFLGVLVAYLLTDLPSTRYFLALPFALAMLLPAMFWVLAIWRILRLPDRFTEVQRDASLASCIRNAYGLVVLCMLFVGGNLTLVLTGGAGERWPMEIGFVAAMLISASFAWLSAAQAKKLDALKKTAP